MDNSLTKSLSNYTSKAPVKDYKKLKNDEQELRKHFHNELNSHPNKKNINIAIIDFQEIFILEYLVIFDLVEEGYDYFILKGSRFSGKSTFIVQFIIVDMILNPQHSWMCAMMNKIDHSDATMQEFDNWINIIDGMWDGFKNAWEKADGQSIKEWRFRFNGNYQKVKFVGIDELSARTIYPPTGGVWRGLFVEELQSAKEKAGMDVDKKAEKMEALTTFSGSAVRFFNRLPQELQETTNFLQFFALNPYNGEDKGLKEFNQYHPDNRVELETYGFDMKKVPELNKVFITSNFRVNDYLPQQALKWMEEIKRIGGSDADVLVNGMTGNPINTIYRNILPFIDKNKNKIPECSKIGYTGFKGFMVLLDVGNGGKNKRDGLMGLGLLGEKLDGTWIPLNYWESKEWQKRNEFDTEKITIEILKQIKKWEDYYVDFSNVGEVKIIMDNDIHYNSVLVKAFKELPIDWKTQYRITRHTEKYQKNWENEERPQIIKYLITSGILEIYEGLTQQLVSQIRTTKTKENGKIILGNDDSRQTFEMGFYHIAKKVLKNPLNKNMLQDRELMNFYKGIK